MNRFAVLGTLAAIIGAAPFSAQADTATARGGTRTFSTAVTPGGSGQIWVDAISQLPFNPNAAVTATLNAAVVPFVPAGNLFTGFWPFRTSWGPTVTSGVLTKALPYVSVMTSRSSGTSRNGFASSSSSNATISHTVANSSTLSGSATVSVNFEAFARAEDPINYNPGPNTLSETLEAGTELFSSDPTSNAGLEFLLGIPLGEYPGSGCAVTFGGDCLLLAVAAYATGPLLSSSDLITFAYADSITGLDATSIADNLATTFAISGETATLMNDFDIPSFTIDPSDSYSIDTLFDLGVNADVVPEPSTWAMMLIGFAGLGLAGYRNSGKGRLERKEVV